MAKRFTDTDKWKKPFIKSLPPPYKLLWFYILDDCDHAGIWQADFEVASIRIGCEVDEAGMISNFGERVFRVSESKFFIPDFVFFQYGELNENNRLHLSVIQILKKTGKDLYKPLGSPLEGAKDKEQDKDKDKDKEKDRGVGKGFWEKEENKNYPIEECIRIAMADARWVKATSATKPELEIFNTYLEKLSTYEKNPKDYKRHFSNLKLKFPDRLKSTAKILNIDELRAIAREMDKQELLKKQNND